MRHAIEVVPVASRRNREIFMRLPDWLHGDDPHYVAPLLMQRRELLDIAGNPYFRHADVALFLARRHGRPVGRVAAQVDWRVVERQGPIGHFGLLAAEDEAVVAALMHAAENFVRGHFMRVIRGPFNLSINHESGLLVEGHDSAPALLTPHDQPHLAEALVHLGYGKAMDLLGYRVEVDAAPISLGARPSSRLTLRRLDFSDYSAELERALAVFNDAWHDNWGFIPLSPDEIRALADSMRPLLDERLTCLAERDGEALGMLIALPDLNQAIVGLNGRLLPWGWAALLWRLKIRGVNRVRVPLMGVRRRLAGTALGSFIPFAMIEAVRPALKAAGYGQVEMSWVLETNHPMIRMAEAMGGKLAKRWRLYERALP